MHAPDLTKLNFNYFDGVVLVWLVVGVLRGRKQGMSQELLPMIKWIAMVVVGGLFYAPFSKAIRQNTGTAFNVLWANITAYLLIAFAIMILFAWIKKMVGEKLIGSDVFGSSEYYLGMIAGAIRFACMVLMLLALMNSRVYSKEEIEAEAKEMKKSMEDVTLPTYPTVQQAVLSGSLTGSSVRKYLPAILLVPVATEQIPKAVPIKKKDQDIIDNPMGMPRK
jgi:uncharacterized membrane protein required for colicin V production